MRETQPERQRDELKSAKSTLIMADRTSRVYSMAMGKRKLAQTNSLSGGDFESHWRLVRRTNRA